MRKWITFLMTLLVGSSVSYLNADCCSQVTFEAGYRRDDLSWSFEFPACDPFFKLTSKYEDLDIFQIGVHGRTNIGCNLYARASASWGWIFNGDYKEDFKLFFSPASEFGDVDTIDFTTHSENIVDEKYVIDFSVALGYPFYFCDCTMALAPVIGYSFNEQNICIEDGEIFEFTTFDGFAFPSSLDECCCEKTIFRWYGPFVGLDFVYHPTCECWDLYAQLEYHWGHFKLKKHNGFDFSPFEDFDFTDRDAHGWVFAAGADYDFCNCWTVGFSVKYQDWSASRHHDECFDSTDFSTVFGTSFSKEDIRTKADWRSFTFNIALGYCF